MSEIDWEANLGKVVKHKTSGKFDRIISYSRGPSEGALGMRRRTGL